MSEYQYYEFRVIDRPLSREDMAALRRVSTQATITSSSFTNEYDYGDFKGDPDKWMERYFDLFLYYANWGTRYFKLRLPKTLLPMEAVNSYCGESLWANTTPEHTILTFAQEEDECWDGWMYSDGMMASLLDLRSELARGDLRCLYLGWLINRDYDLIDESESEEADPESEEFEPPVPPGLKELTPAQFSLVKFFGVDQDLLAAAAQRSAPLKKRDFNRSEFHKWVVGLAQDVKDSLLIRVVDGNGASIPTELSNRFEIESSPTEVNAAEPKPRSLRELQDLKSQVREARVHAEAVREAAALKKCLDSLAKRLPEIWTQIEELALTKKVNHYDEAVKLLSNLRDLAKRGDIPDFEERVAEFRMRHSTKRALWGRLDRVGL